MSDLTFTFRFDHPLSRDEADVLARAMAELIRLNPPDSETWSYSLECPPEQAYALGVATAEIVGGLAKLTPAPNGNGQRKPARKAVARKKVGARRAATPKHSARKAAQPTGLAQATCGICGQSLAAKYLPLHLRKKHPEADAASVAE